MTQENPGNPNYVNPQQPVQGQMNHAPQNGGYAPNGAYPAYPQNAPNNAYPPYNSNLPNQNQAGAPRTPTPQGTYPQNGVMPNMPPQGGQPGGYRQQYAYRQMGANQQMPGPAAPVPPMQPQTPPQPNVRPAGEEQLQQELERQICAFGSSITDGFRFGFDGRGNEIGTRAKQMGSAFANIVNYGVNQGVGAMNRAQQNPQGQNGYHYSYRYDSRHDRRYRYDGSHRNRMYTLPKGPLRSAAGSRLGIGLAQVIVGGIFLFCFGVGGGVCFGLGLGFIEAALWITGASLLAACLPFLWMTVRGSHNLKASSRLRAYAAAAGSQESISITALARASQRSIADTKKTLRYLLKKGFLTAWLDEENDMLYLSEQAYYATLQQQEKAQKEAAETQQNKQKEAEQVKENATLASMKNFIAVLEQEKNMMQSDPGAVAELDQMQKTSASIYEWVRQHPDSMSKSQRLASYYIPTTLKLLHTYNEVGQEGGDNAESIRRDVSGMLHTLNTAFTNLYNNLLSDVALDVSTEITAMQTMLAQDGLSMDDPILHPQQ